MPSSPLPVCCNIHPCPGEIQTRGDEEFRMCLLLLFIFRTQEKQEGNVLMLRVLLEPLFPRGLRKGQQFLSASHGLQKQLMGESLSHSSCLRTEITEGSLGDLLGGRLSSDSCLRTKAAWSKSWQLPQDEIFPDISPQVTAWSFKPVPAH